MEYVDERKGSPPVIARIKDDSLLFDARTLQEKDFGDILLRISSIIE
jgi:seryl-tRNA(Sec) selenium transferase